MSRGFGAAKSASRNSSAGFTSSGAEVHVLGRGMRVKGRVTGDGDVRLEGEVEGEVKVTGQFEVGATGTFVGTLSASQVMIDGAVTGDVESTGPVHIRAGARVAGDVHASEVSLEEGASFRGRVDASFDLPDGLADGPAAPARGSQTGSASARRR